jgi:anti-sigma regulatory factor (Ser/Thr protein kinase)
MPADLVLDLSATTSGLRECLDRIEQSCTGRNIPRAMVARLRIVVEELYSNTIKHGYGGESQRPVRLLLRSAPRIELVYEDAAPPFDPTAWRPPAPHSSTAASARRASRWSSAWRRARATSACPTATG